MVAIDVRQSDAGGSYSRRKAVTGVGGLRVARITFTRVSEVFIGVQTTYRELSDEKREEKKKNCSGFSVTMVTGDVGRWKSSS